MALTSQCIVYHLFPKIYSETGVYTNVHCKANVQNSVVFQRFLHVFVMSINFLYCLISLNLLKSNYSSVSLLYAYTEISWGFNIALDKRGMQINIFHYFSMKIYVGTHKKRLAE